MSSVAEKVAFQEEPRGGDRPVILVADDDGTQRLFFRQALDAAGFDVIEAEDGATALTAFERCRPALALLDVLMPVMDGFAACAALRATEAGRHAPILMMTSLDDIGAVERAYHAGATDFIVKPFNWKILVHRIRYMLRADDTLQRLGKSERYLAEAQRIAALGNFSWRIGSKEIEGSAEFYRIACAAEQGPPLLLRAVLRHIPAPGRTRLLQAVRVALRDGKPLQCDLSCAPGHTPARSIELRAEIAADAAGKAVVQGTVQDISERKRTEAALVSSRRSGESAAAMKTALLASMNHELRTPLNAIIAFSEVLSSGALGTGGGEPYQEFVSDTHRAGLHMLELVTNILEMAKLASTGYQPDYEPVDLRTLAGDALASAREMEPAQIRDVALIDWDGPTMVKADRRAVKQMLVHLLSNALKFSAAETSVDVTCRKAVSGELWLSVVDRGIGMTPEEAAIAVQPFQQIDNGLARKHEGAGIGLSIVSKLIASHGGRLVIESKRGEGSRVSLVFPNELVVAESEAPEKGSC